LGQAGKEETMKLYMHPVSNTSRPVLLLIADNNLGVEQEVVDLMKGAHLQEPYISVNPNGLVPVLVDGDFKLTESSAILKYLADKFDLPAYPKDLKLRAKVNEAMDWFNTNLYRDFAYGVVYPQLFPHHKRPSDEIQSGTINWGKELSKKWLKVLNEHIIGPDRKFLVGDQLTLADYFGAGLLTSGELIGCDFTGYPNVQRWLDNVKKSTHWDKVNEVFYSVRESVKSMPFVTV
jgi:glutathione S-transferase